MANGLDKSHKVESPSPPPKFPFGLFLGAAGILATLFGGYWVSETDKGLNWVPWFLIGLGGFYCLSYILWCWKKNLLPNVTLRIILLVLLIVGFAVIYWQYDNYKKERMGYQILESHITLYILSNGSAQIERKQILEVLIPSLKEIPESDFYASSPILRDSIRFETRKLNARFIDSVDESVTIRTIMTIHSDIPHVANIATLFNPALEKDGLYLRELMMTVPSAYDVQNEKDWFELSIIHPTRTVLLKIIAESPRRFNSEEFTFGKVKSKGRTVSGYAKITSAMSRIQGDTLFTWENSDLHVGDLFRFSWEWNMDTQ